MAKKKAWYFSFCPADFLSSPDVAVMTSSEVGQYMLLICYQWQSGVCSLPNDPVRLAAYARTVSVSDLVLSKFPVGEDGNRANARLLEDWQKVSEKSEEQSRKAKIRWEDATAMPRHTKTDATAMPVISHQQVVSSKTDGDGPAARKSEEGRQETSEMMALAPNVCHGNAAASTGLFGNPLQPLIDKHSQGLVDAVIAHSKTMVDKEGKPFWIYHTPSAVAKTWDTRLTQYQASLVRKPAASKNRWQNTGKSDHIKVTEI